MMELLELADKKFKRAVTNIFKDLENTDALSEVNWSLSRETEIIFLR